MYIANRNMGLSEGWSLVGLSVVSSWGLDRLLYGYEVLREYSRVEPGPIHPRAHLPLTQPAGEQVGMESHGTIDNCGYRLPP